MAGPLDWELEADKCVCSVSFPCGGVRR
jgi:hypothetical protein